MDKHRFSQNRLAPSRQDGGSSAHCACGPGKACGCHGAGAQRAPVGRALDDSTRLQMESHFKHDFSRVRVHTDERAARSVQAAAALAYTQGDMISFSRGSFAPSTSAGQRLLAHELAHVVQQTRRSGSTLSTDSSAAEAEADAAAESIAAHRPPHVRLAVAAGVPQGQATTGTTRRSPTPTPLDAAAEAIVARATTGSGDQKLRAVRLAYDILNAYYAGYASRVSGVGFDNKASAKLLGTEKEEGFGRYVLRFHLGR
jgi:hypothetical protein